MAVLTNNNLIKVNGAVADSKQEMADAGAIVTTIGTPGSDTNFPTEQAVREAITAVSGLGYLTADTTVNLTSSQSATQIQAEIDAQPRNLNGFSLTFQFANGTYTLTDQLYFNAFYNGNLYIYGNSSDSTLSTTKSVYLNSTGAHHCFRILNCKRIEIQYLKIESDSPYSCILCEDTILKVNACYLLGNSTASGAGVYNSYGNCYVSNTYVNNFQYGFRYNTCIAASVNNDDYVGTTPAYGMYAAYGTIVGKTGTQPTGTTASQSSTGGAEFLT